VVISRARRKRLSRRTTALFASSTGMPDESVTPRRGVIVQCRGGRERGVLVEWWHNSLRMKAYQNSGFTVVNHAHRSTAVTIPPVEILDIGYIESDKSYDFHCPL